MDNIHILLCEDNEEIIMITEFFLKSKNYNVSVVRTTEEIISFLEKETPDVLLLDLNLPTRGGEYIVRWIREKSTIHLPVIVFSADSRAEEIAASLKTDGCIKKPFDLNLLQQEIISVFTKKQKPGM